MEGLSSSSLSLSLLPSGYNILFSLQVVEALVGEGKTSVVVTADLDKDKLQQLFEWATVSETQTIC